MFSSSRNLSNLCRNESLIKYSKPSDVPMYVRLQTIYSIPRYLLHDHFVCCQLRDSCQIPVPSDRWSKQFEFSANIRELPAVLLRNVTDLQKMSGMFKSKSTTPSTKGTGEQQSKAKSPSKTVTGGRQYIAKGTDSKSLKKNDEETKDANARAAEARKLEFGRVCCTCESPHVYMDGVSAHDRNCHPRHPQSPGGNQSCSLCTLVRIFGHGKEFLLNHIGERTGATGWFHNIDNCMLYYNDMNSQKSCTCHQAVGSNFLYTCEIRRGS